MIRIRFVFFACAALAVNSYAVETKFWRQSEQADFEKGSLDKLSLRSDGRLSLGPAFPEIFDSATPYLWSIAADSKGNLYTAGGGSGSGLAKLFVIDARGHGRTLAELEGLEIHAVAVDPSGQVYAATNPDGKIYKISAEGKSRLFYDPHAKYIWALAFNAQGDLFVATGDQGDIHRVTPDGKGSVFFRTEETHARSLAIDRSGNLIVGTEPGGLILRISPRGEGFVLYQTAKREVTAVAAAPNGEIYAAATGARAASAPALSLPTPPAPPPSAPAQAAAAAAAPRTSAPPPSLAVSAPAVSGGSEAYRIDTDGAPRKVWSNAQDVVYAIGFDAAGRPLLGAGNRGRIYRLDSETLSTLLVDAPPTQITGFVSGPAGRLYAITGNIGKVYQIGPNLTANGAFESEVLDAGGFTYWGRLSWRGSGANIAVFTRSGNLNRPHANWSPWARVPASNGRVSSPAARFLQYKIEIAGAASEVDSLDIAYLSKNVAPIIDEVEITPPNYHFAISLLASLAPSQTITLPAIGQPRKSSNAPPVVADAGGSQSLTYLKGQIGARWSASDENGDTLIYTVEIRGARETIWKPLKDKIKEKYLSWDSTAFPDGEYQLRVTASDAPSNPAGEALTAALISEPFLIDNTPPQIVGLAATFTAGKLHVRWKAVDARSNIAKAEYSVNGGEWLLTLPTTKLSDAPEEEYALTLDRTSPGEQIIAVRVTDAYDNQTVEKVTLK
jgi:hypothetical protein